MEEYTEKELQKEIDRTELRLMYLSNFIKCDDCGRMVHFDNLGQNEHYATLCKRCTI